MNVGKTVAGKYKQNYNKFIIIIIVIIFRGAEMKFGCA